PSLHACFCLLEARSAKIFAREQGLGRFFGNWVRVRPQRPLMLAPNAARSAVANQLAARRFSVHSASKRDEARRIHGEDEADVCARARADRLRHAAIESNRAR